MVAIKGRGWELVPCLVALVDEIDRAYPDRQKVSDGSIGDLSHAARSSQHNPDTTGDVRAVDITEDHENGPDLRALWNDIIRRKDPRVLYLIYEGQIVKSYVDNRGRPAWVPQPYTGLNAHEHHLHVSVLDTDQKFNTGPWLRKEQDPMATLDNHDLDNIAARVASVIKEELFTKFFNTQKSNNEIHAVASDVKGLLQWGLVPDDKNPPDFKVAAFARAGELTRLLREIKTQVDSLSAPADVRGQVADLLKEASDDLRTG